MPEPKRPIAQRPKAPELPAPKRYLSPPLTRPELRAAFQAAGIDPRRATAEERVTERAMSAQRNDDGVETKREGSSPPSAPGDDAKWTALLQVLERLAEREDDRRGRRDSIADAEERATDAGDLLEKKTVDAHEVFDKLSKWWKVAAIALGAIVVGGSACGSTVFGYLAASKASADTTKGVATEAAEKAVKEAPKPVERERVIYVERAPATLPSAYTIPGDQ